MADALLPGCPSFAQNRSAHSEPLCCSSFVVIQGDIQVNPDSVYSYRWTELNDLISAVRDIRHAALRTPIMLEPQIVELLTCQERPGTDVQPWYVPRRANRLVPSFAIVNHILRLCRSALPFS